MKSRPEREYAPAEFVYAIVYASNLIVARGLNLKNICNSRLTLLCEEMM